MPKAYSNDFRERVVAAPDRGLSASGAARIFGVSISTAIRWTRRVRDAGSAAAKPCGGDTRSKLTDHATWLMELIRQQPDLTLTEIQQRLRRQSRFGRLRHGVALLRQPEDQLEKNAARRRTGAKRRRGGAPSLARESTFA